MYSTGQYGLFDLRPDIPSIKLSKEHALKDRTLSPSHRERPKNVMSRGALKLTVARAMDQPATPLPFRNQFKAIRNIWKDGI